MSPEIGLNLRSNSTIISAISSFCGDNVVRLADLPICPPGLMLEPLRQMIAFGGQAVTVKVRFLGDYFAIYFEVKGGMAGWLLSEHARQLRGFARAETAFKVCRQLGLSSVMVDLDAPAGDSTAEAA